MKCGQCQPEWHVQHLKCGHEPCGQKECCFEREVLVITIRASGFAMLFKNGMCNKIHICKKIGLIEEVMEILGFLRTWDYENRRRFSLWPRAKICIKIMRFCLKKKGFISNKRISNVGYRFLKITLGKWFWDSENRK